MPSTDSQYSKLIEQFDLACSNRDLPSARRISRHIVNVMSDPTMPIDIARAEAVLRTYAAELHGWEIAP